VNLGGGVHLTYCTNIHPGESWAEVRANLDRYVVAVRDRLQPPGRFGVGLRLSARAAAELAQPGALAEFRGWLQRERMYVFTINGFPYGAFHGTRVKDDVYLPDWRESERRAYSDRLADLLAELLPGDLEIEGSVSTVPGAYKAALRGAGDVAAIVEQLLAHVAHLVGLKARSGRTIVLALEPEPLCLLETVDEVIAFFDTHLRAAAAARRLSALAGLDAVQSARALHDHLGVCLDLCHAAVEFEEPAQCIAKLRAAGIRVAKMQISAGLRLPSLDRAALGALKRFDDPVYLHQVIERGPAGLQRFADLPQALASLEGRPNDGCEWRVHFHVPIFLEQLPPFASTQPFVRGALAIQRAEALSAHLEVETYTWGVLPEAYRSGSVDEAVARELAWVQEELRP
jgi:sugar phosphate isomerase/epimerase